MSWYNASWPYRKKLTIDGTKVISGSHTDFPVMFDISDAHILKNMQPYGRDVVITDSDEITKLNHEIVRAAPLLNFNAMPQNLITCTDYKNSRSYVAWIDTSGQQVIGQYDHSSDTWSTFTLKSSIEVDNHNAPAVVVLNDGKILTVMATSHISGDLFRRRSTNANDISAFDAETDLNLDATGYTYPKLFELGAESNKVYLFWRQSGAGAQKDHRFSTSTDGGVNFAAAQTFFAVSGEQPYFAIAQNGSGRLDFVTTTGHPTSVTTNSIYHFYYSGGQWFKSDGTQITSSFPFGTSDATQVYSGATNRAGQAVAIAIEAGGAPRILFVKGVTSATDLRIMHARWNGSSWDVNEVVAAGSAVLGATDPWNPGGMCFDPADPNTVYVSREVATGFWEMERYTTANSGATWILAESITQNSGDTHNLWPTTVRNAGTNFKIVWSYGQFTSATVWLSRLQGYKTIKSSLAKLYGYVKVPTLPSSNKDLYLYYGNAAASDQQNVNGTWNSNYKMVLHMKRGRVSGASKVPDSTSTGAHASYPGGSSNPSEQLGNFGFSHRFDRSDDFLSGTTLLNIASFTELHIEAWVKPSAVTTNPQTIFSNFSGTVAASALFRLETTDILAVNVRRVGNSILSKNSFDLTSVLNAWNWLAMFYDTAAGLNCRLNGSDDTITAGTGNLHGTASVAYEIGRSPGGTAHLWNGDLEEIRVMNVKLSTGWRDTQYNNQSSPGTFYALGALELYGAAILFRRHPMLTHLAM